MTSLESTSGGCGLATIAAVVASTALTISTAKDWLVRRPQTPPARAPIRTPMPVMMMSASDGARALGEVPAHGKEVRMALMDRTSMGRYGMAAIAAGVFTALAVASSGPAWGQDSRRRNRDPTIIPRSGDGATRHADDDGRPSDSGDAAQLTGHGFLLDKGVFTAIDHPDAVGETAVFGINNRGRIVGAYTDAEGTVRSFLLDDGVFTPIEHPERRPAATIAFGLNDRGQVVGAYVDADGSCQVSCWTGAMVLGTRGSSSAIDHPDAGTEPCTGTVPSASTTAAGSWASTSMPSGKGPWLRAGQGPRRPAGRRRLHHHRFPGRRPRHRGPSHQQPRPDVGFYNPSEATASKRGFLLDDGEFTTIDHPDATFEIDGAGTNLFGLNDRGQIVGQFRFKLSRFPAERRHLHHDRPPGRSVRDRRRRHQQSRPDRRLL